MFDFRSQSMSFIPSISRHGFPISSQYPEESSDDSEEAEEEVEEEEEEATKKQVETIEAETRELKKTLKGSKPIYEDYLMPGSGRASSESGSEPDRKRKIRRAKDSDYEVESESELDLLKRELKELKSALVEKSKRTVKRDREEQQAVPTTATTSAQSSEKIVSYKAKKPRAQPRGGLGYKTQRQLTSLARQQAQLAEKIIHISRAADADKRK